MAPHASNREQDCLLCACTCKSTQACSRHRPAQNCKASRPQQNSIKDFPSDEWTIGAWNNGNKVTASMPWSGVMHFRVEGEMSKRQTSYGGLAAIIDMAFCQELNASPPLWMNEMKGWVTERERVRVAGRKMEESLGGGAGICRVEGKEERGNKRADTQCGNKLISTFRQRATDLCKLSDDMKPEPNQEEMFINRLCPNRPSPFLFEERFTPTHIKDGVHLFFPEAERKKRDWRNGPTGAEKLIIHVCLLLLRDERK